GYGETARASAEARSRAGADAARSVCFRLDATSPPTMISVSPREGPVPDSDPGYPKGLMRVRTRPALPQHPTTSCFSLLRSGEGGPKGRMRSGYLSTSIRDPTLTPTPLPMGEGLKHCEPGTLRRAAHSANDNWKLPQRCVHDFAHKHMTSGHRSRT